MYHVFYSDICKKKNVLRLKCRGKSFPFSTHVKMFHEVSKAPWCLCLCYNVYPTQNIPYRTGRLPEMKYKIQLFTRSRNLPDLMEKKFTLFSCLLLITLANSLDPGQHRQHACPDLDSTGPDLDPKYLTP